MNNTKIVEVFKNIKHLTYIDFLKEVQKPFYKDIPDNILHYCFNISHKNSILATHPFTGQQVDILTHKPIPAVSIEQPKIELTIQSKPVKAQTKLDPVEMLRQKIIDVLRKEEELTLEDLHKEISIDLSCEEEELETQLGYLNSVNEITYKMGKARLLE